MRLVGERVPSAPGELRGPQAAPDTQFGHGFQIQNQGLVPWNAGVVNYHPRAQGREELTDTTMA